MSIRRWQTLRWCRTAALALVAAASLIWSGAASAQGTAPPAPAAPVAAAAEEDNRGMDILMKMARTLAQMQSFSVSVRNSYDAIQESGERIEFGGTQRILLQRPDRLRVDLMRSDGDTGMVLFDGKSVTAYKAGDNVYAVVEKPGTVDAMLVYLVKDLQMTIPLARMFHTGLPQQLERIVESAAYVEADANFDPPVDHIAVRADEVDCQFWITQGEQSLPQRIVITYREVPGQPQFRADFSDWNLAPGTVAERFAFIPPQGAEQVPFIIRTRFSGAAPEKEGGAK